MLNDGIGGGLAPVAVVPTPARPHPGTVTAGLAMPGAVSALLSPCRNHKASHVRQSSVRCVIRHEARWPWCHVPAPSKMATEVPGSRRCSKSNHFGNTDDAAGSKAFVQLRRVVSPAR